MVLYGFTCHCISCCVLTFDIGLSCHRSLHSKNNEEGAQESSKAKLAVEETFFFFLDIYVFMSDGLFF